jgi:hypothetical protein
VDSSIDQQHRQPGSSIDYHYLYADSAPQSDSNNDDGSSSVAGDVKGIKQSSSSTSDKQNSGQDKENSSKGGHSSVRRVASFTYSPEGASDRHNKRENGSTSRKFTL